MRIRWRSKRIAKNTRSYSHSEKRYRQMINPVHDRAMIHARSRRKNPTRSLLSFVLSWHPRGVTTAYP